MTAHGSTPAPSPRGNVILHVALYYVVTLGAIALAARHMPGFVPGLADRPAPATFPATTFPPAGPAPYVNASARTAAVAMLGALLLAIPVAWLYVLTRAKRGYQQSVVQTLILLPLVVAGVVALVKDSLPLAFGLAGIVAAVRFRTALDDSKDAVYIFVATGLGLAAAVDLQVAAVVSLFFNVAILVLWRTEFGRMPAAMEGRAAERKLQALAAQLTTTGSFAARLDDELFEHMPAEQLQAVADRAWRRARRNNPELPDPDGRRESLLRVRTHDVAAARDIAEPILAESVKRWRYGGATREAEDTRVVEYVVSFRRGSNPEDMLAALRAADPAAVMDVELA